MGVGIGEIIAIAKDALAPVGSTLSDVWAGLIGDKVAAWRLKNIMATQKEVFEEARRAGLTINTSKIPERYAVAWFEEAAKQDEPEIQTLFARLLVRASEGDKDALDRRHVTTLGQFTPIDAAIFDNLFNPKHKEGGWNPPIVRLPRWNYEATVRSLSITFGEAAGSSTEHLINLGVLARGFQLEQRRRASRGLVFGEESNTTLSVKNELLATALGWSLHMALKEAPIK